METRHMTKKQKLSRPRTGTSLTSKLERNFGSINFNWGRPLLNLPWNVFRALNTKKRPTKRLQSAFFAGGNVMKLIDNFVGKK